MTSSPASIPTDPPRTPDGAIDADALAAICRDAPYGHATLTRTVMGEPRAVRVAVVAVVPDQGTLIYTHDGVWISYATASSETTWALDTPDTDPAGPWVSVAFADGDAYDAAVDAANDAGGSTDAVAWHLAQWDYGTETDEAHTRDGAPWGSADTLHTVTVGGLAYVLSVNHRLGYYGLSRRPLASAS